MPTLTSQFQGALVTPTKTILSSGPMLFNIRGISFLRRRGSDLSVLGICGLNGGAIELKAMEIFEGYDISCQKTIFYTCEPNGVQNV